MLIVGECVEAGVLYFLVVWIGRGANCVLCVGARTLFVSLKVLVHSCAHIVVFLASDVSTLINSSLEGRPQLRWWRVTLWKIILVCKESKLVG